MSRNSISIVKSNIFMTLTGVQIIRLKPPRLTQTQSFWKHDHVCEITYCSFSKEVNVLTMSPDLEQIVTLNTVNREKCSHHWQCVFESERSAHWAQFCCASEESEECFYSAGHQDESPTNTHITTGHSVAACLNWSAEQMCSTIWNKGEPKDIFVNTSRQFCVDYGTEEYRGCLFLCPNTVLSLRCLVSIWVIMCAADPLSQLGARTDTNTRKHTQESLIGQNSVRMSLSSQTGKAFIIDCLVYRHPLFFHIQWGHLQ